MTGFPFQQFHRAQTLWLVLLWLQTFAFSSLYGQQSQAESRWVDSTLQEMSLEEKIGQLFILTTYSNQTEKDYAYIERLVREEHLGGLIFMQGNPRDQIKLINRYQKQAYLPLLIAQDAEWGLSMRLRGVPSYPRNMTLGAVRDDSLLYYLGREMARDLQSVGVQVNFAPVVDVNNNARNPVINYRSFGEDKYRVARKGIMISQGMQDQGIMACAKHFPGHGDTDTDSHYDLPIIDHPINRLDTLELYPFQKLIESGVGAVMVAHLYIPSLDPTTNQASSLSRPIITDLLRKKMGFDGLVFTDALNMHGVTKFYSPGEICLKALQAGNDLLLSPTNVPLSARLIKQAIQKGEWSQAELDDRVRRMLRTKYRTGLAAYQPASIEKATTILERPEIQVLRKRLYESAVTIPLNKDRLLPIDHLAQKSIAYVQIGGGAKNRFEESLKKYASVSRFYLRRNFTSADKAGLMRKLEDYDTVILGMFGMNQRAKDNFGILEPAPRLSRDLSASGKKVILSLFGNPYALRNFGTEAAVVVAYEDVPEAQGAAAAAIFGGIAVSGRLPVTASSTFRAGQGFPIPRAVRFGFGFPEESRMDRKELSKIDSLAYHYIARRAMPGCQILVMKGNRIVYDKAFGRMEYDRKSSVIDAYQHTYDLASVTKVAATTLAAMSLVEDGRLNLDQPIKAYLTDLRGTPLAELTPRRLLQHNAGLPSWAPLHLETFQDSRRKIINREFLSYVPSPSHVYPIAPGFYASSALQDWAWEQIKLVEVRNTTRTRYSDLGLIIMGRVMEHILGEDLAAYVERQFYRPMGMDHTYFQPTQKGKGRDCPPTEIDRQWRNCTIKGYVHDPTSALFGGISGHAGLFSNIYDLAKYSLMIKNGGNYAFDRYLKPQTIHYFTKQQRQNSRKGLGWDKPEISPYRTNPVSEWASMKTFGHTGFTGTCLWVDPQYDLVYIFLSNRTYPRASNQLLLKENVRILIMDQIYKSMARYQQKPLDLPFL
ncbi:MAG: glycoside hydrolase family 3 N-terminal domain-containing protein [Bacteroidota bacterium]